MGDNEDVERRRRKGAEGGGAAAAGNPLFRSHSIANMTETDSQAASELFNYFCGQANTLKSVLRSFRMLCEVLRLKPTEFPYFYPKLKSKLNTWKAQALWTKFDKRAAHKCYGRGKVCAGQRVLVIGCGPCGLRTAIEAQFLGAKVVVVEKRDRFSRNNVLHLWPYNIHDLRGLGAKKFYGKFCAGAIDHISIRQLQCILLKVALLLGVEVYESVGFESLIEPADVETGWRARCDPADHPVSQYEFDVLIGADGKRNTLPGFSRKEFRGKLAIAITANFINRHSEAESQVEEISGVAFIFNQKFFNDLNEAKGIALENIVYYKDETHYFVMTAKKQSLLKKGVIKANDADTARLLASSNIDQEKLFDYAREAADFATNYQMPSLDFAVNHYGKPDVAMFDFTSMFQSDNSCRVIERHGHRLVMALVGDSLLEPFWPTGTGCARGFFGGLDACWLMRQMSIGKMTAVEAVAERESIYRVLSGTTPENTCKDYAAYNVDPHTRYPTLNTRLILPAQVSHLFDTDDPSQLEEDLQNARRKKESGFNTSVVTATAPRRKESHVSPDALLGWLVKQVEAYDKVVISDMTTSFQSGQALAAIIHRYRPDLVDFHEFDPRHAADNIQTCFDVLETEMGILPIMTGRELADLTRKPDKLSMMSYLSQVYECFKKEIPAVSRSLGHHNQSDDDLLMDQHNNMGNPGKKGSRQSQGRTKPSIGELVASDNRHHKKARRSRGESESNAKSEAEKTGKSNKENLKETNRLNKSAHRKRVQKLLEGKPTGKPDHASKEPKLMPRSIKEDDKFKAIEKQFGLGPKRRSGEGGSATDKRPKEIRREIGKLDKEDWNLKSIEDKLISKKGDDSVEKSGNKVPKWSKAAFQDKFNIMKTKLQGGEHDGSSELSGSASKYAEVDASLDKLQKKLREGSALETGQRGSNKVSALAAGLLRSGGGKMERSNTASEIMLTKNYGPQMMLGAQRQQQQQQATAGPANRSENCHFCAKRVYVVERMCAEGKFFHRSCFRCDYCNILLRLGSYVFHREGPFAGKFFCLPHSTSNAMEKYRYRNKGDEIRDADKRKMEIKHQPTSEWGGVRAAPDIKKVPEEKSRKKSYGSQAESASTRASAAAAANTYLQSLTDAHKRRVIESMKHELRGTTPERANFEVAAPSDEDENDGVTGGDVSMGGAASKGGGGGVGATGGRRSGPKIMDEDEWTEQNFGASSLINVEDDEGTNTSDDSVSDLDSESDDSSDYSDEEDEEEVVEVRPRRRLAKNSDDEPSQYENVKKVEHRYSLPLHLMLPSDGNSSPLSSSSISSEDEEGREAEYVEDGEYEYSTDSELDEGCTNIRLPVPPPVPKRGNSSKRQANKAAAATTAATADADTETEDTSSDSSEDSDSEVTETSFDSELNASESLTECEFTDSEGRPNPFIKHHQPAGAAAAAAAPPIVVVNDDFDCVPPAGQRVYPNSGSEDVEDEDDVKNYRKFASPAYKARYQYKTPNVSDRLKKTEDSVNAFKLNQARSTQRALNLKKNWAMTSEATPPVGGAGIKAPETTPSAAESDRLKSLMDRLSSQQSLLKPAAKPSSQMEHFLKKTTSSQNVKSPVGSPPVNANSMRSFTFSSSSYIPQTLSTNAASIVRPVVTTTGQQQSAITTVSFTPASGKPAEEPPVITLDSTTADSNAEDKRDESSLASVEIVETVKPEQKEHKPVDSTVSLGSTCDEIAKLNFGDEVSDVEDIDGGDGGKDTTGESLYKSCIEEDQPQSAAPIAAQEEDEEDEVSFHTPPARTVVHVVANSKSLVDLECSPDVHQPPLATSSPLTESKSTSSIPQNQQLEPSVPTAPPAPLEEVKTTVKLTENELTQIYRLQNPVERLARLNSLKRRQGSVVANMLSKPSPQTPANSVAKPTPPRGSSKLRSRAPISFSNAPPLPPPDLPQAPATAPPVEAETSALGLDFPLIDADADGTSPHASPVKKRTVSESSTANLPATPLTDPAKFGIPVKRPPRTKAAAAAASSAAQTTPKRNESRPAPPTTLPAAVADHSLDKMDGAVSSGADSTPSSPSKKKTLMKTITGMFKGKPATTTTTPLASPEQEDLSPERKSRSEVPFIRGLMGGPQRSMSAKPVTNGNKKPRRHPTSFRTGSLTIRATHPSTPPVPLSRKISLNAVAKATANGTSNSSELSSGGESDEDTSSSLNVVNEVNKTPSSTSRLPPDLVEKLVRKSRKNSGKHYKAAQLKRVRKAHEIQRQLEEIDVKHKELEERGIIAEKSLRGEDSDDDELVALDNAVTTNGNGSDHYDAGLMKTWFRLLAEKNSLIRQEQELLVQNRLLELEDGSAKLERELRGLLSSEGGGSAKTIPREGELLKELVEMAEQKDLLKAMLAKDKARYQKEDADIEAQMQAKILKV